MSDRFYLGVDARVRVGYDECDPTGKGLRRKLKAFGYTGPFKLRVEPGTPPEEIAAFFPEDDNWTWPDVKEFRVYYRDKELSEPETIGDLLASIEEAEKALPGGLPQ